MRIKVFTHTDLDGAGTPLVLRSLLNTLITGKKTFDVSYCSTGDYGSINRDIVKFINTEHERYDRIYITDLSPNEETMGQLIQYSKKYGTKVQVFDHHESAMNIQEKFPEQACILVRHDDGQLTSGTSVVFEQLVGMTPCEAIHDKNTNKTLLRIARFAEAVREFDTWDWQHKKEQCIFGEEARKLNNLYYALGTEDFLKSYFPIPMKLFADKHLYLLDFLDKEEENYIVNRMNHVKFGKLKDYTFAFVSAERFISTLGNSMCTLKHGDELVDFAMIFNNGKMSFRAGKDSEVNVAEIAKAYFNGGGHAKSSGGKLMGFNSFDLIQEHLNEVAV